MIEMAKSESNSSRNRETNNHFDDSLKIHSIKEELRGL
jgi:hypothetical protein